jgi:hypothetical protein
MHAGIDCEVLLTMWERGFGLSPGARDDSLLHLSSDTLDPPRSIGERNARLVELHARMFGPELELLSHCPACGTVAQFSNDCKVLAAQMRPTFDRTPPFQLESHGHLIEFRLPDSSDIDASAFADGVDDFAQRVLDRCVLACVREGSPILPSALPTPVLDRLSQEMEALDPGASVSFALDCPQCAAHWQAPLNVGETVWLKVRAAAERILLDVDTLARAYGWTEREVLSLNPLRRAAYLQMVTA